MNFYEMDQQVSLDKNKEVMVVSKLARKLGEKSNKFTPLVKFVARDPEMLALLDELISGASLAQQSLTRPIFDNK